MTITITEKEYAAMKDVFDQVRTDYQGASNEEYLEKMGESLDLVRDVLDKYVKARARANEFNILRGIISKKYHGMQPRDIDRLTRLCLKRVEKSV